VPGADEASISAVTRRRAVRTPAASGALARAVDQAQYQTGQGPCLDSLYEQQTLRLSDVSREPRWADFCARATQLGVRSMLAIQLYVEGDNLGALNLHSRQVDAFSDESEQVGLMFAAHAAVAMAGAQQQEQMVAAVDSWDLIGQAKGILIERYKISSLEAFRLLVVASQTPTSSCTTSPSTWLGPAHLPPPSPDGGNTEPRTNPDRERPIVCVSDGGGHGVGIAPGSRS
jgi:hypothetical protein